MYLKPIISGLLTVIPGYRFLRKSRTGGTDSAEYCYGVWFKHLTLLWESGLREIPDTLAELGPGDSIGTGLAALLSGVNNYYALDVVKFADTEHNLSIFEELVELFKKRIGTKDTKGWPDYTPYLDKNLFPSHILTDKILNRALTLERIDTIRDAIMNPESENKGVSIKYIVPWYDPKIIIPESVDVIFSHAALEHVIDLENTYKSFSAWLKPKGFMSHQIDFTSHGISKEWNGYRRYPELLWKIIVGKRPFLLNRQPCSKHVSLLKKNGFEIICLLKRYRSDGIKRSELSSQWKDISEDDITCSGTFIQVRKI